MDQVQAQFKHDLLVMEDIIDKCIADGVLTIGTGHDPLFVQIMDKNTFGEKTTEEEIIIKMDSLCRKTLRDNNLICLFTHTYIKDEHVICFGVTIGKEPEDIDFEPDTPEGIA